MSPLSYVFLVSVAVLLAGFWVLGRELRNCRQGFEDATGFQEGIPSDLTTDVMPMRVPTTPWMENAFRNAESGRPVLVGCSPAANRDQDSLSRSTELMSAA